MWGLWLMPLTGLIFVSVAVMAVIAAIVIRPKRPTAWLGLVGAPLGCAALPLLALMLIGGVNTLMQASDRALFAEIWGFAPDMDESAMLSDDFGGSHNRWIYMRLEPSPQDRQRILALAPRVSRSTAEQFANHRLTHGFTWWETECAAPDIRDAGGYRGWRQLTVYDCLESHRMFIVAYRP